ncbi:hypothetical protein BC939DRAFT_481860 [Gamsiella multidivaricata]|uniref:uncharacterized protein n=1 Tax=Gamsiella multidivaricata TaxID=101098 RepID=UPI00221E5517|nr:uncharacterized protein BC939DRAFT_481860 [Gamsiella multidivaricata]KAI7816629.1 hypothetical protein BC939DRAFT_481860 [Gamsiella multidivaricata]
MPLAWLDDFSLFSTMQESNYKHVISHEYKIDSMLRKGNSAMETDILKFSKWISDHKDQAQFASRDSALGTVMTMAVQGFSSGPAMYASREVFFLRNMAREASPVCFWTGTQLSLTVINCPRRKFSVDRRCLIKERLSCMEQRTRSWWPLRTFRTACMLLPIDNSFFMDRTVDQRIQYLKNIEQGWEDGVQWTDHIIEELRDGFDAEKEKKPWTAEWEQRWRKFVNSKVHRDRVVWSKFEWRFFLETCQGRSLVTGQPIAQCGVVSSMMAATRLQTAF